MSKAAVFNGDVDCNGDFRVTGNVTPAKTKTNILAVATETFTVPMSAWRVWDAYDNPLTDSPATDDLGCIGGTFNTNAPSLQSDDMGGNGAATHYYARAEIPLPATYVAAQAVTIRLHAGMLTTVADQEATVDIQVYKSDEDSTSTGDLCATAPDSDNMNSLVFADIDFTVTPTTLSPGDLLDVLIDMTLDDDGDLGVMKGCIGSVQLICGTR